MLVQQLGLPILPLRRRHKAARLQVGVALRGLLRQRHAPLLQFSLKLQLAACFLQFALPAPGRGGTHFCLPAELLQIGHQTRAPQLQQRCQCFVGVGGICAAALGGKTQQRRTGAHA